MAKFQISLSVVVLLGLAALTLAVDEPVPAKLEVKQPANIKVKIIDNSKILTKEEVEKMVNNGKAPLPIVDPIVDPIAVDPVVNEKKDEAVAKQPEQPQQDVNLKLDLPPIPPLLLPNIPDAPPFLQNIFGTNDDQADNKQSAIEGQPQDKPKGIINVIMVKASSKLDDAENGVKSSFVIFKFLPKPLNNFFGLNDNDNDDDDDDDDDDEPEKTGLDTNSEKQGQKILGGDDDPEKKRIHLLGGGGENDPDRIRFRLDNDRGVFTGGDDLLINTQPIEQHHYFIFSMIDRIRNMFSQMGASQSVEDGERSVEQEPFIIRTDDGAAAIIPNDIGYAEKQQQSLNKCMMLNFMRLKASMYYRTILHLLFFTGVLLFILSLTMLTVRTYKRRRYVRQPLNVATIETGGKGSGSEKTKMNLYRAWNNGAFDYHSSAIGGADSKAVLIQAPPAYDQVIINDRTSSLTSQSVSSRLLSNNKSSDECETKSLPPEYELTVNNNNN